MSPEIIYSLIAALTSSVVTFVVLREKFNRDNLATRNSAANKIMALEKAIHDKQIEYTIEKNKIIEQQLTQEKNTAATTFADGFKAGQLDREKDLQISISQAREELISSFSKNISEAESKGFLEGYEKGRLEQKIDDDIHLREQSLVFQKELFSETLKIKTQLEADFLQKQREIEQQIYVVVRPYVEIETEKGIIYDTHQSNAGYQYQLMINGIPVFQPHIIIENKETLKEVNQERLDKLLAVAEELASQAIHAQLPTGKAKKLLTIGKAIVSRKQKQ